ncbi:nucleotidyltransferase domain-containing protein [Marispirochaeta sp.]|uniref:nucleotidyltransferase domain-containing protein n=1 Tax=Marispirochaeta sp. TaxID=2038653 RepID=UPI0029C6F2C8|nr:nucleotidyltransferase domain-containing protein [Marispirochaeta sp.]
MRITVREQEAIRETAFEIFGDTSKVILFGSRADDAKKGGDIDLMIETEETSSNALSKKIPFLVKLKQKIGDRKIDVVIRAADSGAQPIYKIARSEGVEVT